jgi:hydrogenase maturation protease
MSTLVAGVGNIFFGDDGFGVEVAQRLMREPPIDDVDVREFGIQGVHLAYELTGGRYDRCVLIDAVARGGAPGTLYAIEPDDTVSGAGVAAPDAHTLTPDVVLAWARHVGGPCARVVIVGCEPATLEPAIGLSPHVAAAIVPAVAMVRRLVAREERVPCA